MRTIVNFDIMIFFFRNNHDKLVYSRYFVHELMIEKKTSQSIVAIVKLTPSSFDTIGLSIV